MQILKFMPAAIVLTFFSLGTTAHACNADILIIKDWSLLTTGDHSGRLTTIVQSNAKRKIVSLNASIVFEDAAGDMLFSSYIDPGLNLAPQETHGFESTLMEMETLYHMRKQAVKASVCLRSVKYSDGSSQSFNE